MAQVMKVLGGSQGPTPDQTLGVMGQDVKKLTPEQLRRFQEAVRSRQTQGPPRG